MTNEDIKKIVFEHPDVNNPTKYPTKKEDVDDDKVNHPTHYLSFRKDGIECIDAMVSAFGTTAVAHFCICNAFKYLWRHPSKGYMEDIEKAMWYLNKYKELNIIDLGE